MYTSTIRLTNHTDYGLRLLMLGATASPSPISIPSVASRLNVSRNHLMKVAQCLARAGLLESVRGPLGGFRLAKQPQDIRIGDAVRTLEPGIALVECMRSSEPACPLVQGCRLPSLLREASRAFFETLDGCNLQDLVAGNSQLVRLTGVE